MRFGAAADKNERCIPLKFNSKILVTGATGYVGARLIPRLLEAGYFVRAMGRSVDKMADRSWACHPGVELVQGDVSESHSLLKALQGCEAAYYLVHAMTARKKKFAEADRQWAHNMTNAAEKARLRQIIYLGGLGDPQHPDLSRHLASRHEVADILQSGAVPTTVLRAAMILGSGSASFEILRYLTERLPLMITPKWIYTPTQPIAVTNVIAYLEGCLGNTKTFGKTYDIGGPDRLNYRQLIDIYSEEAGLVPRKIIPVPVLSPTLSARWIHLVTPVPTTIALPLTQGLSVATVCEADDIRTLLPVQLISCRQAIRTALDQILEEQVESCWSDAGKIQPPEWAVCGDAGYSGGTILSCAYKLTLKSSSEKVWSQVIGIGGQQGYFYGNWLWRLRGMIDRCLGGVGIARGRRHSSELHTGDALDFWRVLKVVRNHRLTLKAEMKVPGEAVLDLQIHPLHDGKIEVHMISRFLPRGLAGLLYWYCLYPFHVLIFKGMLTAIAKRVNAPVPGTPQRMVLSPPKQCALSNKGSIDLR